MMYRVAFEGANLMKMSLVIAAAMLAICLLALAETTNTAEAEDSLLKNGKIAFTRSDSEGREMYTVDPDGSNLNRLTNDFYEEDIVVGSWQPAWSPDGTKLAFGSGQIWVMGADGSNLREILPNRYEQYSGSDTQLTSGATWSPDGTKLAFHKGVLPHHVDDIYMTDLDGSNVVNLTQTPRLSELEPDFSPDGSKICFTLYSDSVEAARPGAESSKKSALGIYVMNADGSDPTLLAGEHSAGGVTGRQTGRR